MSRIEQLQQLISITWDGDLISKTDRDLLVKLGYAEREGGYNFISSKGVKLLVDMGYLPLKVSCRPGPPCKTIL